MALSSVPQRQRHLQAMALFCMVLLVALLLSACGGNPQQQQKAEQSKRELDKALTHAKSIGVPDALLKSIKDQKDQLSHFNAPLTAVADQSANQYYSNMAQRYQMLTIQVYGLEHQTTQQFDYQANNNLQSFSSILSQRQSQGYPSAKSFATQLAQQQNMMAKAQYPKDYLQISNQAQASTEALRKMGPTNDKLLALRQAIKQLTTSSLDVTALQEQEKDDTQQFQVARTPADFDNLADRLNVQLQQSATISTQAIPYVGAAKLKQFSADINDMKSYGVDTKQYEKRLESNQSALDKAQTFKDFLKVSAQIDSDIASIQLPLLRGQANHLLKAYHQEVDQWGNANQYYDKYNGTSYKLDYPYDQQGIGSDLDAAVQYAQTIDDYNSAITTINNTMLHLKALEANSKDSTPWNQVHATDIQLMQHYNAQNSQVIVVSLIEQTLRLYENGKLVRAFHITSGQYDRPSMPGYGQIMDRESPTKFKSSEPKGSAFWYPDTKINYAMLYHTGGYFLHDSWWRADYGPGTNFPHYDSSGNQKFSGNGSHGCVNLPPDMAGWLYNQTSYNTMALIY